MGTHPIFESDFDCLTGPFVSAKMSLIEEQSASVAATTATSTTTRAKLENQSSCDSGVSSDYESFSDEDKQLESLSIELPLIRHFTICPIQRSGPIASITLARSNRSNSSGPFTTMLNCPRTSPLAVI